MEPTLETSWRSCDETTSRPQPGHGTRPRHRSGRARVRALGGSRRQDRRRRGGRGRDAPHDRLRLDGRRRRDRRRREGRGAHALQRRAAARRAADVAVDPIDGDPHERRPAQRAVGDRPCPARLDVLPGAALYMEDRHRPRGRRRDRHRRAGRGEHPTGRQGEGQAPRGGDGDDPRPPSAHRHDRGDPRRQGTCCDHRRRRRGRDRRRDPARRSTSSWGSVVRPRASGGGRAQVHGWRDAGQAVPAQRRGTRVAARRRFRPRSGARRRYSAAGTICSSRRPGSPTLPARRGAVGSDGATTSRW